MYTRCLTIEDIVVHKLKRQSTSCRVARRTVDENEVVAVSCDNLVSIL